MNKLEAIEQIEVLYPPDDTHEGTSRIGQNLLNKATFDIDGRYGSLPIREWRRYPVAVLVRLAELCLEYETQEIVKTKELVAA